MKRLYSNVSTAKAALQQRPEVFDSVGVNLPIYVLLKMVYDLMSVFGREADIVHKFIGHNRSASLNVVSDETVHLLLVSPIAEDGSFNLPIALKSAHDNSLAVTALHSNSVAETAAFALVHVPRLAANIGFIYFNSL